MDFNIKYVNLLLDLIKIYFLLNYQNDLQYTRMFFLIYDYLSVVHSLSK